MMTSVQAFAEAMKYENRANPYPFFDELRKTPVARVTNGIYAVTGYNEIITLAHDPRVSSDLRNCAQAPTQSANKADAMSEMMEKYGKEPMMITADPPDHDRARRQAMRHFGPPHSPDLIPGVEPDCQRIVNDLLDKARGKTRIDVVDEYAYPLPVTVICPVLGVPLQDESLFHAWIADLMAGADMGCHSDLHLMEMPAGARQFQIPFTLGHENAGWVEKLGPGTTGCALGDPVIVYGPWGCGLCMNCRVGMENYCEKPGGPAPGGLGGYDGGMAPYLLVPATRFLVPLGTLNPRDAAPLSDAVLTSYHAIKRSRHLLGPGSTAVVIGAGAWAQMAIQVLRALSATTTITAVDTAVDKLETAKRMGADEGLLSGDKGVKRVQDVSRGQSAELVLDMVGVNPTLQMASQMARVLGLLTIVGIGGGVLSVNFLSPPHECSVASPFWARSPSSWKWLIWPSLEKSRCWSNTFHWIARARLTAFSTTARFRDVPSSHRTVERGDLRPCQNLVSQTALLRISQQRNDRCFISASPALRRGKKHCERIGCISLTAKLSRTLAVWFSAGDRNPCRNQSVQF
jgi:propanol-preferring alcohol dehydrogenase